jgi:hypothetical protein
MGGGVEQCGKADGEEKALLQMVPKHHWAGSNEFHTKREVEKSQQEFPWKVE